MSQQSRKPESRAQKSPQGTASIPALKSGGAEPESPAQLHVDRAPTPVEPAPDWAMCALCYLGILALIPFFLRKDDPFISWHARQGVLWAIFCFIAYVALFVATLFPLVGRVAIPLYGLYGLGVLGISLFGIWQACQGKRWGIPWVSTWWNALPESQTSGPVR